MAAPVPVTAIAGASGPADAAMVVTWTIVPAVVYLGGLRRLRASGSRAVGLLAAAAAVLGLAVLGIALTPVVDRASDARFAAHMAQHLALGLIAPLLLVLGRVGEVVPWALPTRARAPLRGRWRRLVPRHRSAVAAGAVSVAVWYAWHVPALYGLAASSNAVHALEHLSLLGAGAWLWSSVAPQRRRTGATIVALFGVTLGTGLLGATLALSPSAFYGPWIGDLAGDALLDDQHLGGLLMWTPGGLVYLLATVVQLSRWLDASGDRQDPHGHRPPQAGPTRSREAPGASVPAAP